MCYNVSNFVVSHRRGSSLFAAYFLNACAISLKLGDYVNIGSWSYYHTNVGNNSIINTLSLVFSQYD